MEQTQTKADNFFTPIGNTKPFFKAAFEGFAGSGKTFTSAKIAIGLHQQIESKKPVIIFDTEKASKFLKPIFGEAGIEVLVRESRSIADLKEVFARMRSGASDILIIDSISHVWENFLESYKQKVHRTALQFQDWGIIKPTWKSEFSEPFVQDAYHIIMTGRAGYEYENEINPDTQKREIYKSGVKMKVEGETAYEPDLLVYMEQMEEILGNDKHVYNQATVLKDRANLIQGKTFKNPDYEVFQPVIEAMLLNPVKQVSAAEQDAGYLFKTEDEKYAFKRERKILLEEIEGYLVQVKPGQDAASKKFKIDAIAHAFGTRSWTEMEGFAPLFLRDGFQKLQDYVRGMIAQEKAGIPPLTKLPKAPATSGKKK